MIKLKVDKGDLITLVNGKAPNYSVFEEPLVKKCGSYVGGLDDRWIWSFEALKNLSEEELIELYTICKK